MVQIDVSEVKLLKEELTKNTDKGTSAIAETKARLGNIKDMDSFKGDGAKATKNYISNAHDNLIEVYDNIIADLKSNFTYSMNQVSR
ncbi:T7SS effector LXG polymorphic toxin [Enterococcus crotali]|uniref:T7SS effector LXG polymorphic toxin n=1 Tax=Enterococcus crotali TaxID=1453587 RepID=UPI000472F005|nr:T7SS effector LXG polymorphic toxin [Enterococcus crotali]